MINTCIAEAKKDLEAINTKNKYVSSPYLFISANLLHFSCVLSQSRRCNFQKFPWLVGANHGGASSNSKCHPFKSNLSALYIL